MTYSANLLFCLFDSSLIENCRVKAPALKDVLSNEGPLRVHMQRIYRRVCTSYISSWWESTSQRFRSTISLLPLGALFMVEIVRAAPESPSLMFEVRLTQLWLIVNSAGNTVDWQIPPPHCRAAWNYVSCWRKWPGRPCNHLVHLRRGEKKVILRFVEATSQSLALIFNPFEAHAPADLNDRHALDQRGGADRWILSAKGLIGVKTPWPLSPA